MWNINLNYQQSYRESKPQNSSFYVFIAYMLFKPFISTNAAPATTPPLLHSSTRPYISSTSMEEQIFCCVSAWYGIYS